MADRTTGEFFSPLIEAAIELSSQWHDQTYRKKRWRKAPFDVPADEILRVPVMAHVTAVAMNVQRAGWEEEVVAAAFLHDVLEDANRYGQRLLGEVLRMELGDGVLGYVREVTEQQFDANERRREWRERKADYVQQIRTGTTQASAISLADKLHNLWSINQALEKGIDVFAADQHGKGLRGGPEEHLWFYEAVLKATENHEDGRLAPMQARLEVEIQRLRTKVGNKE
ncbi:MAG: HD domain-containing protein [Rhodothermales bacterium]